jgi:hypothetical protein
MANNPMSLSDEIEATPVAKATSQVVKTVTQAAAQQAKATSQAIVNQLYGISSPTDTTTDTSIDPQQQIPINSLRNKQHLHNLRSNIKHLNSNSLHQIRHSWSRHEEHYSKHIHQNILIQQSVVWRRI